MKRLKRQVRRTQTSKPDTAAVMDSARSNAILPPRPPDFVFLPNAHDQFAVAKLRFAPIGGLAIDHLVQDDLQLTPKLREALVQVYFNAAQRRELRKATKRQIDLAKSAHKHLIQAMEYLETACPDGRDGLKRLLAGPALDDPKGEREMNQFGAMTEAVRLDLARSSHVLHSVINAEAKKARKSGERAKRLRNLVEALASWWSMGGGTSIAPYVKANRRDNAPAIVHGRSGKFLELAIALFCRVDVFKNSEVVAAVTNVHEVQLGVNETRAVFQRRRGMRQRRRSLPKPSPSVSNKGKT